MRVVTKVYNQRGYRTRKRWFNEGIFFQLATPYGLILLRGLGYKKPHQLQAIMISCCESPLTYQGYNCTRCATPLVYQPLVELMQPEARKDIDTANETLLHLRPEEAVVGLLEPWLAHTGLDLFEQIVTAHDLLKDLQDFACSLKGTWSILVPKASITGMDYMGEDESLDTWSV